MRLSIAKFLPCAWPGSWHARTLVLTAAWGAVLVGATHWRNRHAPPPPGHRPLARAEDGYVGSDT